MAPRTVNDVVGVLRQWFPPELAADWDNVGLLLGTADAPVRKVMTCLTVTPDSADEAVRDAADLIVTHHPILFRPTKRLTDGTPEGRIVLTLAQAGVAVYSPHTAFDNSPGGINDILAERLELTGVRPLRTVAAAHCKIVVFVPDNDLARVSDALFAAGAGEIGEYRECGFCLAGTGTFFGGDATNPTVGARGRREEVSEWRLEVVCPEARVDAVVAAMRAAHSYEEPAYDIYPLRPAAGKHGMGRIGELAGPLPLRELAERARVKLGAASVPTVGDPARPIRTVALACGAAGEFLADAGRARADAFLTGEMRFHDLLAAQAQGVAVLLPGHYATERCGVEVLAGRLQTELPDAKVWASRRERDPLGA
jgi:dinuclear metal center YbgI/SA1388 family protein